MLAEFQKFWSERINTDLIYLCCFDSVIVLFTLVQCKRFGLMWGFDELVLMRISTARTHGLRNIFFRIRLSAYKVSSES